ncbi:Protein zwilch like protein [Willisornis vidua]|uniref:Protein zwilch n=1 Tax=Willisornis vidua TaxID=1566151 RepID=A0ABQ9DGS8_9PASS|nr:Protein zwilch like protein [Willisornis vidua]
MGLILSTPAGLGLSLSGLERKPQASTFTWSHVMVTTKGSAQYELIQGAAIEDTIIESGSNIYVDITWNIVDKILETPPLISAATLNIALECGDPRSPVYQVYRELQLLLALAEGLKTGVTEWPEPLESESAVELVQEFLTDLKKKLDGDGVSGNKNETEANKLFQTIKCDTAAVDSYIKSIFSERGDLDFAEQLWCKMRSVGSYQELTDCFTLVIKSLERGEIQPWIHQGSSSFLRTLIQQSYHGRMEGVALSGITPIRMLFEIGLDKMRKDYVSFFIGQELATLTYLYYKENPLNEKHVFQLPIRPAVVKKFYQNEHPEMWKVEISSGHGAKEVKTMWQVSTNPPVEHMASNHSAFQFNLANMSDWF